jgi:predicted Rdx family selenoprotein
MAAWMATEIWHEFGGDAPVTLIPVAQGRLEVHAGGETLFDRKAEGGAYPDRSRVREIKQEIKRRLDSGASRS